MNLSPLHDPPAYGTPLLKGGRKDRLTRCSAEIFNCPSPEYVTILPAPALRAFVSHYWLSFGGAKSVHVALPDGAVDLVIQVQPNEVQSWIYGTTTARTDIVLNQHCHYLGIRFKPGQSRHFIKPSALDLTDSYTVTHHALRFSLNAVPERVQSHELAHQLNALLEINTLLENHLAKYSPPHQRIDDIIHCIEAARGAIRINEAAACFGQSRRHFERVFLETVGVSAKTFAKIIRFQHAAKCLGHPNRLPLAQIAAELNYTDQSHMSRDFKHLAGVSPTQFLCHHGAFLQDVPIE